uniref:Dynein light chain n=1 Tax=Panagrellus redivivus TaxID=6233 RepID=A0A7E4VPY3_PANRE
MFPTPQTKIKFCRVDMPEATKKRLEAKLYESLRKLPSEKWKMELGRRIKDSLDAGNEKGEGPWHCAVGTKFALNTTNKGNGFAHVMIGRYVHLVVWQTVEKVCMVNEDTDLTSFEDKVNTAVEKPHASA